MTITPLLLLLPLLTAAYNLKTTNVMIYKAPSLNNITSGSFFGYSVLLASQMRISYNGSFVYEPWLFVGAPKANYPGQSDRGKNEIPKEPGVTYRCPLPHDCVPIKVENPGDEEGFIDQVFLRSLIEKKYGWLGAAMSLHEPNNSLTVCAPRTIVRIYTSEDTYHNTMHGVCYNGKLYSGDLQMANKNFPNYDFTSKFWYNPLNGFAVHYPTSQEHTNESNVPVIGSPTQELYGSVRKMGQRKTVELPVGDDLSHFGYALTSGYYFNKKQLMAASGAPGWQYVGQVAIMDLGVNPFSIVNTSVSGKEVGEYFGSSLATGDLNGDGLDDLIVGAPHWENDNGRVHIFFGNKAGFFEADILLEGLVDDAQYGYAVACGDLDNDGVEDLIVGAPWEDSGVIYVYNGDAELQEYQEHRLFRPSQRIAASDISANILRFGFSLSKPIDIDGNRHPDVAVGAYASGHVVIMRSRPAVVMTMTLSTLTKTLPRNSTDLELKICLDMLPLTPGNLMWSTLIFVMVDEDYKRFDQNKTGFVFIRKPSGYCITKKIPLQKNIRNYLDPIEVVASGKFLTKHGDCMEETAMGLLCPINYKARNATARMKLSFDIGCAMNEICRASIFGTLDFQGISNPIWMIGSDDLSLVLRIGNRQEPAYLTTATFDIPKGIYLRSILPSCQEEENREALRVTCEVGNPLGTDMKETISLDLDMSGMHNGSAHGTTLNFSVKIKTRSVNEGISSIDIPLHLKANISITLSGKAYDNSYYFKYDENTTNVPFKHTYQISKFGATPIFEALLTISIPYKIGDLEFLTIGHKPRASILARFYECTHTGVSMTKRLIDDKVSIKATIDDDFHLDTIANLSRIRRTASQDNIMDVRRGDTISHAISNNFTETESEKNAQSELYTMSKSENVNITYLNCSVPNVTCGQVVCKIPSLKTAQDVANLHLHLLVNGSMLAGGTEEKEKAIHIATQATVQVLDPKMKFAVSGADIIIPVTTELHYAPNVRGEISIWIILGSVLLGLLALCLIAGVLWRVGFFRRIKKEELDTQKKNETVPLNSSTSSQQLDDVFI